MKQTINRKDYISYLFFAIATFYLFQGAILAPHKIMYAITGDCAKNVYTFLYHVKFGSGVHFTGMNFPYGEHIVFTDNQPILVLLLSWLNQWFDFSFSTLLGIMHSLIPVSFWVGMVFTYKILRHYHITALFATILATLIICLSPQVFRVPGHFALSYTCFIPMMFYWNLKFAESTRRKYLLRIMLLCTVFALLHFYYLAIAVFWAFGYVLGYLVSVRGDVRRKIVHAALFSGSIIAAFLVVFIFMKATDTISDRPVIPHAPEHEFPVARLLTNIVSPIWQGIEQSNIIESRFIKHDTNDPGYVGIPLVMMMLAGIILWFNAKLKKQKVGFGFEYVWLILGGVTLLYSLYSNDLWDIPLLKNRFPSLRQFRAADRLSWIFYFIISIYSAVVLQYLFDTLFKRKKGLAVSLLVVVVGLWTVEANGYVIFLEKQSLDWKRNYDHFFLTKIKNWNEFLNEQKLKPNDFQSILSLPLVVIGSEKIWLPEQSDISIAYAFRAGLQLELPIMDINMSRTSWSQSFDQSTTASGWFGRKRMFEIIGDKPILVIHHSPDELNPDEQALLDASSYLGQVEMLDVYKLFPKEFLKKQDSIRKLALDIASIQKVQDTALGENVNYFVHHGFPIEKGIAFAGGNTFYPTFQKDSLLLTWQLPAGAANRKYEISAWAKVPENDFRSPHLSVLCKDSVGTEMLKIIVWCKHSTDNDKGYWLRFGKYFIVPENCASIEIYAHNDPEPTYLSMDEILIRPENTTIISKYNEGKIMANNHVISY